MRKAKRLILVPMKDPSEAKTRLATCLSAAARADLARRLFHQTMRQVTKIAAADASLTCAVVTASDDIRAHAKAYGAEVVEEPVQGGLNAALERAVDWANAHRFASLCILPADLAAPDPQELTALLTHKLAAETIVLSPSSDLGTNALLTPLPKQFAFAYGARSFHAHRAAAEAAGLTPVVARWPSLIVDIDREIDLRQHGQALLHEALS